MDYDERLNYARTFLMDAILCGSQKWTKARVKTLEEGIKSMPKDAGNMKRDFLLSRTPPLPIKDGGLDLELGQMLLVAIAARGGHWHEFIDRVGKEFGTKAYADVIIGFYVFRNFYKLCHEDRAYLISELIRKEHYEDNIVDFVNTGYFRSVHNSPKIKYIRALGNNGMYEALKKFRKSRAEYVQVELVTHLPVEELIYQLDISSARAIEIIERRMNKESA